MKLVDFTVNTPEEHLALDELLLAKAEKGELEETLRFWESEEYFIVVGRSGKASEDCFIDRCRNDNIRILRRISGGGTVLQGPGCLNFSLILSYEGNAAYEKINSSYREIMGRISDAIRTSGLALDLHPISDLAIKGKKVSGNSQARKRKYFLHHGTVLHDFNLNMISQYLKHPSKEPEYREGRSHKDFLTNISIKRKEIEESIKEVFCFSNEVWQPEEDDLKELKELVTNKYATETWNLAF
ncbi:MAG: lipoate--protein ligase family protein [Candidatus Omnitrophota bacterium]